MVAQTKILPIGEWLPDFPDFNNPGILVARNITPLSKQSYGPIPALKSIGVFPIPEQILGVFTFMDSQEKEHIFAGTPTKLYHFKAGDLAFTDVSRENGPYNAYVSNPWVGTSFGPSLIFCNGIDPPQTFEPGVDAKFFNLANATPSQPATATTPFVPARNAAPVGRCVATVRNWTMFGNINDGGTIYPNRVAWSAIGDPSYWPIPGTLEAAVVQSDFNDLPSGLGWIRGIASGLQAADAAVLCDNGIVSVSFTGSPTTFGFALAQNSAGCRASSSIVTHRGICYYLGQDGFYQHSGVQGQSISGTRIDRFFFNDQNDGVDPSFITLTQGTVDTSGRLILWLYPSRGSGGVLDRMLIYNFLLDRWSFAQVTAQWASKGISLGYSLDQLDPFGTVDTILISFDSPYWKGGSPALYVFDSTGLLSTFSGDPLPARVETAEYQFTQSARSRLTSSRPLVDGGTALVSVGTRNRQFDPVTWSPLVSQNYHGECPQRVDARYMRVRIDIPTPVAINPEASHASDFTDATLTQGTTGLDLPLNTTYDQWFTVAYHRSDLSLSDYFTEPQLDTDLWNPWIGSDYFGNTDRKTRFISRPPNSIEPSINTGSTIGAGPSNSYSGWTLWEFSLNPTTGTPIPSFDSEIFDPDHLVTGPMTVYSNGGLAITASHTSYPAYTLGFGDAFGKSVRIEEGVNKLVFNDPGFSATATTSAPTPPGSKVLHFTVVPDDLQRGMKVTDENHLDDNDYIAIGGNPGFHVPSTIESFDDTTVTLSIETGAAGVPAGDTIKFQTGVLNRLLPEAPYYVISDSNAIWPDTTITYQDAVSLDWTQGSGPGAQLWVDAACSSDGAKLVAVTNGFIWTSVDYGQNWSQRGTSNNWTGCASSNDGSVLYACAAGDLCYKSTNSGVTWNPLTLPAPVNLFGAFQQMCCSGSGNIVYVTVAGGGTFAIYKSTNGGSTWAVANSTPLNWFGIACSDTGAVVLASEQEHHLYVSNNSGSTWSVAPTGITFDPVSWSKVYVTPDGTHMIGVINGAFLVTSADTGLTWERQFATATPSGQRQAACQSADGTKVTYSNLGDDQLYYSSNSGFNYLPIDGILTEHCVALTCNDDFTSFAAFDSGTTGGFAYVSHGSGPFTRLTMSAPAQTTDPNHLVRLSRFGWMSGFINGNTFRWPETGGYLQFRSKYPDTRYGCNAQLNFYPTSGTDFEAGGLSNFSLEAGYTEFGDDIDPRTQFLVGFFDGTTTGLLTPDMSQDYHTWGFEYWPWINFSIYLDGELQWATAAAIFTGEISGSTLVVQGSVMSILGGLMTPGKWLRYTGSSQRLYLHDGIDTTWTVYDFDTGLPVDLAVTETVMSVSVNTTANQNANMYGENSIGLGCTMMIGSQGFHTLSDFTQHPGPYTWLISGIELYDLPPMPAPVPGPHAASKTEHGNAVDTLDATVTPPPPPTSMVWTYSPSFGTSAGSDYVGIWWASKRPDADTGFNSSVFPISGSGAYIVVPDTGSFRVKVGLYWNTGGWSNPGRVFVKIMFINGTHADMVFTAGDGVSYDVNQRFRMETPILPVSKINPATPLQAHVEFKFTGGTLLFPACNPTGTCEPYHGDTTVATGGDSYFIVEWWP